MNCNPLLGLLRDYLLKHVLYVIKVGDNVEKLNQQARDLDAKRKTVEDAIQVQESSTSRKCTKEVENWLEKVAKILNSSKEIQEAYDNKNCMLCTSSCSFNCCFNYSIGKKAFKILEEVGTAMGQINQIIDYTAEMVPPRLQRLNTITIESVPTPLQQKALSFIKDDTKGGTLGIWGMGGVGKTRLLKFINNSLEEADQFYCIFVTASRGCTKEKLQNSLVDNLKLPKKGDLSKVIFYCLKSKNFLLLIDDLWEPLDLKDIGIPHPLGICGDYKRKVVLTTRLQRVCGNMGTGRNIINVKCLEWDEAWALFEKNVGQDIIVDSANPQIRTLAKDVARECCGHPLTLITVGRAMSQNETVYMWKDALEKLRTSRLYDIPDIQGMGEHSHTLSLLSVSYDYLKTPRLKECFLLCALWPEDFSIDYDDLIRCWMGHGLLDVFDNIEEVYREGMVVIDTLLKACLLEQGEKDIRNPTLRSVKMHDLTRDMAFWVAHDRDVNKKKWLVLTDGVDESKMVAVTPETEKLSIFFFFRHIEGFASMIRNWLHVTTLIMEGDVLKNDDLVNLQHCRSLKYLHMHNNHQINDIPVDICTLDTLEYIYWRPRDFAQMVVPWEMKKLTNLKYLFLGRVEGIADGVLSNLTSLLVLDMVRNSEDASSVIIDELLERSGRQLKALGIRVYTPSSIEKLARLSGTTVTSLVIENMEDCTTIPLFSDNFLGRLHMHSHLKSLEINNCFSLEEIVMMQGGGGRSSCRLKETQELELIKLYELKEIVWRGVEPVDVFPELRRISIQSCNQLENVSWVAHLPCLESLRLLDCHRLSNVVVLHEQVEAADRQPTTIFPTLRKLDLHCLDSLISICDQEINAFPSLEYLVVSRCPQLKRLPFLPSAASSGKLQKIRARAEWWLNLELDSDLRTSLQPLLYCC